MKVRVKAVDRFERDFRLRLPFRFGVITVTHGTQAILRVRVELEDGRSSEGVAGSALTLVAGPRAVALCAPIIVHWNRLVWNIHGWFRHVWSWHIFQA